MPPYDVNFVGISAGAVMTASGLPIVLEALDPKTVTGTLIFPGGPGARNSQFDAAARALLSAASSNAKRVCSVCTGAFIAASIGLLENKKAVTHWQYCEALAAAYPSIQVEVDPLFIRDGDMWTSAGVTAGIDLTLALIEEDHDAAIAGRVARKLVVYLRRAGGQKQYSGLLALQLAASGPYRSLIDSVIADPLQKWSLEDMAAISGQSLRNFHRKFAQTTGTTPAKAVEGIRCGIAQNLLQTTDLSNQEIAEQAGFRLEGALRRALHRQFGLTPSAIRK